MLTRQNVFVSVLVLILLSLSFFPAVEELTFLLLESLEKQGREKQ